MNEDSSKFVDKIAMEKLISEKLTKVSHSPDKSYFINRDISYGMINEQMLLESEVELAEIINGVSLFHIPSFYRQEFYTENNFIPVYCYPSEAPKANILLVHGLFDENMANFQFLIKQLCRLNYNVFFMILPYHFSRKSKESLFGGEFFFSADLYRTRNAFKQAVMDIEAAMQLIGLHNSLPASVSGFSMGGCVVFQYYLLKKSKVKAFLINPVTEFKRLAWDNTLLLTVGKDLEKSRLRRDEIIRIFDELDPVEQIGTDFSSDNLAMAYSAYDQIIGKRKYGSFIEKIEIKNVVEYSAGHLNVLRVPRLADDINAFLSDNLSRRSVAANASAGVSGG